MSTDRLIEILQEHFSNQEGILYIGYPILSTPDESIAIDALFISPDHGIIAIDLIEGRSLGSFGVRQDEIASLLTAKFMNHKTLRRGRTLLTAPTTITYAPMLNQINKDDTYILANDKNIAPSIKSIEWDNPELYPQVLSIIQSISTIRKSRRRRSIVKDNSHGSALQELEDSISNLDSMQSRAVLETIEGVQRIRGLAGSGKTIVLALKAAYLHSQNPDWRIAVTFNTRSLKEQFTRLIEMFVVDQTGEQPSDNIKVINAWGAPGGKSRSGMYFEFCLKNGASYLDFQQAKAEFGYENAFSGATNNAIRTVKHPKKLYDAILIDEAQDFDPSFLQLCYHSLGKQKRLVYAYDELQSLTDASLPPPEELFGKDENDRPLVSFDGSIKSQDIILKKCYRNSRQVLSTAHALGFGIYRTTQGKLGTGLTQMFDRSELWTDVGYRVIDGSLDDNRWVRLGRSEEASPTFLEAPNTVAPLIEFKSFSNSTEQATWVANQIEKDLGKHGLRAEDIIVINPDPITTIKETGLIRKHLHDKGILSHLAGVDTSGDIFFKPDQDSVAFTGVFRAKGNEAGMVYVINAHDCYSSFGEIGRVRNRLFTAMTRSKAWVRVLGHGVNMDSLIVEFESIKKENYELHFKYPDANLRKRLRIVNRDMSSEEKSRVRTARRSFSSLLADLKNGTVLIEDLPQDQLSALRAILDGNND